ncbi:hypothetical protein V1478_009380, partial [Vespula squamosa]
MELAYRFEVEFEHEINANCQMDWMFLLTLSRRKLSEVCSLLRFKINEENEDKEEQEEEREEQEEQGRKAEEQFELGVPLKNEKNGGKREALTLNISCLRSNESFMARKRKKKREKRKPGNFQFGFNIGKTGRPRRL